MTEPNVPRRRWYDHDERILTFLKTMQSFPIEVQSIIAQAIIDQANDQFKAHEIVESVKSIGVEKLLNIYRSKQRQRLYDQNPLLHRAINYFYILNSENRSFIVGKSSDLVVFTVEYFGLCSTFDEIPSLEEVTMVTKTTLKEGGEKAKTYLKAVKQRFNENAEDKRKIRIEDDKITS